MRLAVTSVGEKIALIADSWAPRCSRVSHTDEWPGTQYRGPVSQSRRLTRLQKTSPLQDGTSRIQDILACVAALREVAAQHCAPLFISVRCAYFFTAPTVDVNNQTPDKHANIVHFSYGMTRCCDTHKCHLVHLPGNSFIGKKSDWTGSDHCNSHRDLTCDCIWSSASIRASGREGCGFTFHRGAMKDFFFFFFSQPELTGTTTFSNRCCEVAERGSEAVQ